MVLNGAPRSGKSSIVAEIQRTFEGPWMNLGVDVFVRGVTPERYRPGIGLRPGRDRPDLEPLVPMLYFAMYGSIAAHSREGLNVVADVSHHDRGILAECAKRLAGLPVLFVGVRCPIEVIMKRRNAGQAGREGGYVTGTAEDPIPPPVRRWQAEVHSVGPYDFEVDTSLLDPVGCAAAIRRRLVEGSIPTAFEVLATF